MSDGKIDLEIRVPGQPPTRHKLSYGVYPVGSEKGNKILISDNGVAPRHAILILRPDRCFVEDLNSRTGTFMDGAPVKGRSELALGGEIKIGDCVLVVGDYAGGVEPEGPEDSDVSIPESREESDAAPTLDQPQAQDPIRAQKCQIKKQIHTELLERLDIKRLTSSNIREEELHQRALKMINQLIQEVSKKLPPWIDPEALAKEIYDETVGLGPLEDLLRDSEVTEIMVNHYNQIYVEKSGKLMLTDKFFMDNHSVLATIERIVAPIGRRIDESQPYVDARLKDGSRVNAIIPPLALKGPCLTIRKFAKQMFGVKDLVRFKTMDARMADFLGVCVLMRQNIIVSGGTGSGKTTFLNVISSFIPDTDRIVTIEDAAELRLPQTHLVRLEARPPNIEGRGQVAIRDLLRNALRMRPDRIIIGECRGGEALDMLQAMNTGHDGSLTTAHANSPRDVISRLETMALMSGLELPSRAIREQIAAAINLIVHTARLSDGARRVMNITEVTGMEGDRITMQDIFEFVQTGIDRHGKVEGHFTATGAVPTFVETIQSRGLNLDMSMFDPRKWR